MYTVSSSVTEFWQNRVQYARTGTRLQVVPKINFYWCDEGRVLCHEVTTPDRRSIDAWLEMGMVLIEGWDRTLCYKTIYDFYNGTITPYIRERAAAESARNPLFGYSAVILPNNFLSTLTFNYVRHDLKISNGKIIREPFRKFAAGLAWLQKQPYAPA
jgi:hypothetical protein